MHISHQTNGDSYFDSNVEFVHRAFGALPNNFPLALQMLMQSSKLALPFGFHLIRA
jgi:hypothetical protein